MPELAEYEKYELYDGKEVMLAAASIPHLEIQGNLYNIIKNFLKGKRCRVFTEAKVVFAKDTFFIPDVLVVCDRSKIKLNHIEGAPDFVAEILSISTQARDIGIKKDMYEKYGVGEYWLIDPKAQSITVYLLKDGRYVLEDVYHNATEEELEGLTEEERKAHKVSLKISLYDDLEIQVKEIFEE
jgi:Uma2 family endonuclease